MDRSPKARFKAQQMGGTPTLLYLFSTLTSCSLLPMGAHTLWILPPPPSCEPHRLCLNSQLPLSGPDWSNPLPAGLDLTLYAAPFCHLEENHNDKPDTDDRADNCKQPKFPIKLVGHQLPGNPLPLDLY